MGARAGVLLAYGTTVRRSIRVLVGILLVVNALDLTTSLLPTFIDVVPLPRRAPLVLMTQLCLLCPLGWGAPRVLGVVSSWWRRLPIPLVPRALISALLLLQLAHVALRMEIYPFTNVGMFSNVVAVPTDGTYRTTTYVLDRAHGVELLRMMREGNPLFAHHFQWDYKAAWVMRMYKGTSGADAVLADGLRVVPALATITYEQRSGRIRSIVTAPAHE